MAKPVALQLYSVREEAAKDFPAVLKKVAKMGYVGVEYAGLHGMKAADVARIVGDLGMVSSSAHAGLPTKENVDQIAADADALGYSRVLCGFGPKDMETEGAVKTCAAKLAAGGEVAQSVGLSLGMHNHWWEFSQKFGGKTVYEMILEGAPKLFSQLDIYWCCHAQADCVAVMRKWAKRVSLLHVKDGDLTEPPVHKAVGEGKVPTKEIIQAADEAVLDWLIVELDHCATDMMEAVEKSVKWLAATGLGTARE